MSEQLIMKEIEESEIPDAVSLHNQARNDHRTVDQWRWEWRGLYPDLAVFCLVKDGGNIVGTMGVIPIHLNISGHRLLTGKVESLFLHPNLRGTDVMPRFYHYMVSRAASKGMSALWAYTPAVKAVRRLIGARITEVMYDSVIRLPPPIDLRSLIRSGDKLRQARGVITSMLSSLRPQVVSSGRFVLKQGLASPSSLDSLYQRLRETFPDLIHIELDEAYIRWRVTQHPFIRYECLSAYEDETLRGYAIVNKQDAQDAYLADLTFENKDVGTELLSRILADLRKTGHCTLNYLGNMSNPLGAKVFALLREFSAVESPNSGMPFASRCLDDDYSDTCNDATHWYMTGLWTEGYMI